jgi:hypothetical protein
MPRGDFGYEDPSWLAEVDTFALGMPAAVVRRRLRTVAWFWPRFLVALSILLECRTSWLAAAPFHHAFDTYSTHHSSSVKRWCSREIQPWLSYKMAAECILLVGVISLS